MSDPKDFDLDEDLFDFGGVSPEPESVPSDENLDEIFASFRAEEAKLQACHRHSFRYRHPRLYPHRRRVCGPIVGRSARA